MKHYSEDDLVLYFYGESRRAGQIDRHLGECADCAARYREIAGTLALIGTPETPRRGEAYGEQIWQRIRHELPEQDSAGWSARLRAHWAPFALAAAALIAVAVAAGVLARRHAVPAPASQLASSVNVPHANAPAADASERIRLAAIGDHLEESERVLMDVVNAQGATIDVSAEQRLAESLIDANRLYRDAADHAGETDIAALLDELERSLLDIAHGPSKLTAAELNRAITRLDATALLFRIRVLSDELHEREAAPVKPRTTL